MGGNGAEWDCGLTRDVAEGQGDPDCFCPQPFSGHLSDRPCQTQNLLPQKDKTCSADACPPPCPQVSSGVLTSCLDSVAQSLRILSLRILGPVPYYLPLQTAALGENDKMYYMDVNRLVRVVGTLIRGVQDGNSGWALGARENQTPYHCLAACKRDSVLPALYCLALSQPLALLGLPQPGQGILPFAL